MVFVHPQFWCIDALCELYLLLMYREGIKGILDLCSSSTEKALRTQKIRSRNARTDSKGKVERQWPPWRPVSIIASVEERVSSMTRSVLIGIDYCPIYLS